MNKIIGLATVIAMCGCSMAPALQGKVSGSSHGMYFADQSKEVVPATTQRGSSHGMFFANQSTKTSTSSHRAISFKE